VHFRNYAPEKIEYATNRYMYEAQRHYGILEARLSKQKYMVGDTYTIVDMALWGWARLIPVALGDTAWAKFPSLKKLIDEIGARPAAARALAIKDKHTFKAEFDDEAKKAMFRHMHEKVA
jgi:GST-like protein